MLTIVLLSGKQGSGKSHVARHVLPRPQIVEVDELIKGCTQFGFWEQLPRNQSRCRLVTSLRSLYPNLSNGPLPILIEGAALCIPIFAGAMLEAIADHLDREIRPEEVGRYYLNPSNEVICSQVKRRIETEPWRRKELAYLGTPQQVANCHSHFDELMTRPENVGWIRETDSIRMHNRIKNDLSSNA